MCLDISVAKTWEENWYQCISETNRKMENRKVVGDEGERRSRCIFMIHNECVDNTHHINNKFPQALSLPLAKVLEDVTVVLVKQLEANS